MHKSAKKWAETLGNGSATRTPWAPALVGASVGAGLASVTALGAAGVAAYFARQVVVPPKQPVENLKILEVGYANSQDKDGDQSASLRQPTTLRLPATAATRAPGRYGFYFDGGASFAVLGQVLSYSPLDESVVREVLEVHAGDLGQANRGRFSGVVAPTPEDMGYRSESIILELPVGDAPAWVVHPGAALASQPQDAVQPSEPSKIWAIMVHGMGSTRAETLRALETTQALGLTSLHLSYRTDREAPSADDGRYGLGFTEWEDIDVAIEYALTHGAQGVVLFGWSMGGAISLQVMDRARYRWAVRALVLDGPAVDWLSLINYHSKLNKLPLRLGELGVSMISKPELKFFTGLEKPIDLARLSWLRRAGDIRVPTLIMHSLDDRYVPASASQELAEKSQLVTFVPFYGATHTREWNVDPVRWRDTVCQWLAPLLT